MATPSPTPAPQSPPARSSFALTGRSVTLDPRTHAVRADIADIRLAEQVFAPHYAVPMETIVARPSPLRLERDGGSEVVATLQSGDVFEVLEIAGVSAWGMAVAAGLVGYIDRSVLDLPGATAA